MCVFVAAVDDPSGLDIEDIAESSNNSSFVEPVEMQLQAIESDESL